MLAREEAPEAGRRTFGAVLSGLQVADEAPGTLRRVVEALHAHGVIALRDQRLTPGQFVRFARRLGRPQPHIKTELRHPDCPEILLLSNVFRDGRPIGIYDGAAYWHTDMSYEEEPASATLVHALQVPERGGETRFCDMVAAYDDLPPERKAEIEGLQVLHHYGNRSDPNEGSRTSATPLTEEQKRQAKNVYHPLVLAHPATGRRALYAVAGSSFGIVGLDDAAAVTLLASLQRHATQQRYQHAHRYEPGDLVIWDNWATLHSASLVEPATGAADTRLLHRISVKGKPSLDG